MCTNLCTELFNLPGAGGDQLGGDGEILHQGSPDLPHLLDTTSPNLAAVQYSTLYTDHCLTNLLSVPEVSLQTQEHLGEPDCPLPRPLDPALQPRQLLAAGVQQGGVGPEVLGSQGLPLGQLHLAGRGHLVLGHGQAVVHPGGGVKILFRSQGFQKANSCVGYNTYMTAPALPRLDVWADLLPVSLTGQVKLPVCESSLVMLVQCTVGKRASLFCSQPCL